MLYLTDVTVAFGGEAILDGLSWTLRPGERVGLVGPNGAGKSTLLRAIAGVQPLDGGLVTMDGGVTIGYLQQDVQEAADETTVVEAAMEAFDEILGKEVEVRELVREMEGMGDHDSPAYMQRVERMTRLQTELDAAEVHLIRPKTEAVLHGLGFAQDDLTRPLRTFSGGWRMRVALARLLLQQPSALLLDEPTNHLDIESIDWLEGYLRSYPGAVVLVSHDRYFLDRMVTQIAEMWGGRITEYVGNYAHYLEAREVQREQHRLAYEAQQREIAQTERFIERFRYKATKAKQVQSRVKALDKLERIPPPPSDEATIHFRFPEPPRSGRAVLEISRFSKVYDGTADDEEARRVEVFRDAGPLVIERGDKVALIGPNGAGKSTLLRILDGREPFDGAREPGYAVEKAFFAQHQAEELPQGATVLEALREVGRGQGETELRTLLGAFLFRGDDVFKPVRVLSGGEKSRLALARTLLSPANFLLLDEPTNHLDMASKAVLIEALRQYGGTFVVVSHDRHFLDQVATTVWRAGGGTVEEYPGTYSDYRHHRESKAVEDDSPPSPSPLPAAKPATNGQSRKPAPDSGPKSKEQKRREAEQRNRLHRALQNGADPSGITDPVLLRRYVERVEAEVTQKEEERGRLEAKLADPSLYEQKEAFTEAMEAFAAAEAELKELMKRWERAAERLAEVGA